MDLVGFLIDPVVSYQFIRVALITAVVVGLTSAVLSCLLVVRHQALLGDAISHAVLLGVAVGYLVGGTTGVLWGALLVAVGTGALITFIERHSIVKLDAVMGICFTAAFALGLAVISVAQPRGIDLFHVLFGNVLGVTTGDLALTAGSGIGVLAVVALLYRQLHLWSFDPQGAQAAGLRVGLLQYVFTGLLSATIVAALQAVGLILVVAMLITPGATGILLASRLPRVMAVAAGVGLVSAVGGLYGSYYVDVASGPAIVLVASACFALAFLFAPKRGLLAQRVRRRQGRQRTRDEDLLKALFDADDPTAAIALPGVAERLGVDEAEVRGRVGALTRRRLVVRANGAATLTDAGRAEALRVIRTHRLLERHAHDADGLSLHELHADADRREHELDPADVDDMDRLLDNPAVDPHGHPIPTAKGELAAIGGRPLSQLPPDVPAVVAMVCDDRADALEEMVRLGILPHRTVRVAEAGAAQLSVYVEDRLVDVPGAVADRVYVTVPGRPEAPVEPSASPRARSRKPPRIPAP